MGSSRGREERASARCAFVGGLKDESRMYNLSLVIGRVDVLTIWNSSDDDMKDPRRVEYARAVI